jgi:hypothetical protein
MAILALTLAEQSSKTMTKVIGQPGYTLPDPRRSQQ